MSGVCLECRAYWDVRGDRIALEIAHRTSTVSAAVALYDRFIAGVHARHLSGLPILPGPSRRVGRIAALMAAITPEVKA